MTKYWLEITDRADLGVNLRAPQRDERNKPYWSYTLIREIIHGDIVFHYHKLEKAIVACSRAAGSVWEDDIVWAAHGTSARDAHSVPRVRTGWYLGLEGFTYLASPLRLEAIRSEEAFIRSLRDRLEALTSEASYFPFAISPRRPLRPMQGYLTRFPAELVEHFTDLADGAAEVLQIQPTIKYPIGSTRRGAVRERLLAPAIDPNGARVGAIGAPYRSADEESARASIEPFDVDPAIVERGVRGHAQTQNALAAFVRKMGCEPRSPRAGEPSFDLAWEQNGGVYIAEVKSLTERNEEKQLRLGLGQVLRYRDLLNGSGKKIVATLVVERQPSDPSWLQLCRSLGILLAWPNRFEELATLPN
jgi:hypothetical protein